LRKRPIARRIVSRSSTTTAAGYDDVATFASPCCWNGRGRAARCAHDIEYGAGRVRRRARSTDAQYTASKIPDAKLSLYDGIGHAPFYEDAARFNAELAAFVSEANGSAGH
jgi:pimeloyl-ACP methyl ester carboxylesterase